MSQFTDFVRVTVGVLSGLLGILFGHAAARCNDPVATPTPSVASQPENETHGEETRLPSKTPDLPPLPARQIAPLQPPTADTTIHLGDQIDQAASEMRQLDRLELPERADVAWSLHERLCNISEQLDASLRPDASDAKTPFVIPNLAPNSVDGKTIWASRRNAVPDHRALVRSLLAAILVAPEKSAFMSKATRHKVEYHEQQGAEDANHVVVIGDVGLIKKTDTAWFLLLIDPFDNAQQHMVRIDHQRLTQRITLGSRVATLGRAVPQADTTSDTPIFATEIYAIKQ